MAVGINNDFTIAQPTGITEGIIQKVHDNTSIYGVVRRIWLAQKYEITLNWSSVTPAQYNQITSKYYGSPDPIRYSNTNSGLSFMGFATTTEAPYIKGASYKRSMKMTIQEV